MNGGKLPQGGSLIEALMALFVLSVGLLGVAAMQLTAMQSNHVALQHSLATIMAADANERLWAALGAANGQCPSGSDVERDWLEHWAGSLPLVEQASTIEKTGTCTYSITVSWHDDRFDLPRKTSSLSYPARLPGRHAR